MTSQSRKIVIIGGGIAGLSAAVYARKCGYEVELLEQHDSPGGLATSWKRGDYTFETCLHWLLGSNATAGNGGPGLLRRLLRLDVVAHRANPSDRTGVGRRTIRTRRRRPAPREMVGLGCHGFAAFRASVLQDVFRAGAAEFDSKTGNFSENAVRPGTNMVTRLRNEGCNFGAVPACSSADATPSSAFITSGGRSPVRSASHSARNQSSRPSGSRRRRRRSAAVASCRAPARRRLPDELGDGENCCNAGDEPHRDSRRPASSKISPD
jgi:2-polyprenyl-6-methoxyphenol hydroxylase-like FAD-dependent oxidoreductase